MEASKPQDLQELLQDERYCHFYLKTGACKYGSCCQRTHLEVASSRTLVAYNMFLDPALETLLQASSSSLNPSLKVTSRRTIPDDEDLEDDLKVQTELKDAFRRVREQSQANFERFYRDTLPEFQKFGEIAMFKCCNNLTQHLRGNLYIEFRNESDCVNCFKRMNGRYYAGKPLSLRFLSLSDWKTAICAYNGKGRCPKLLDCNFLHVYDNPRHAFPVEQRTRKRSRSRIHMLTKMHDAGIFQGANILHSLAAPRSKTTSRSPNRTDRETRRSMHGQTFDFTSSPSPKREPRSSRPLFPLMQSRTIALHSDSPFTEMVKENPDTVMGLTAFRLNMKLSRRKGTDNSDLLPLQSCDESQDVELPRLPECKRTFKPSRMCWNYFATEADIRHLIKAKLYHPIEEGKVSKPARSPLSTEPRSLMLPSTSKAHRTIATSSPKRVSEDPSKPPPAKFLITSSGYQAKRRDNFSATQPKGVAQQTYTPVVPVEASWSSVAEFIAYTREKYRPLFLQLAGRSGERITKESLTWYFSGKAEGDFKRKMVDKSEGEALITEENEEAPALLRGEFSPPYPMKVVSRPRAPVPSPQLLVQASVTPIHSKKNEEHPVRPKEVAALLKVFTDGNSEWVTAEQFTSILVMYEYTWNGFPLKRAAERCNSFDPCDEDLIGKMAAEIRELKKVYVLLADRKTGMVKNRSLEGFLRRMRKEQMQECPQSAKLDPRNFSFFDFCMAIPFIMSDQQDD